jgi:predicted GH43/DUF377 family glycosyl hydrolase
MIKLLNSKYAIVVGLLLFSLIIILPPFIHGYVYPNIGDDTSVYLDRIEQMGRDDVSVQYTGYMLAGYPMLFFRDMLGWDLNTQFLWFNYLMLVIAGIVLYLVFSKLVNKVAGVICLLTVIFCSQGVMYLFYYGQIFNIINLTIILPILLLFCVNYIANGKWYNLVLTILLSILFSSFHTNGIYLPALAGVGLVSYIMYCVIKKEKTNRRVIVASGTISIIAIIAFVVLVLLPTANVLKEYVENPLLSTMNNIGKGMAVPVYSWVISILTPFILGIIVISALYYKSIKEKSDTKNKALFYILLILTVILAIVSFCKISLDPWRQAVDLAIILSMLLSVMMGILLYKQKSIVLIILVVLIIGFGSVLHVNTWFKYNSAMREVDLQAIEYIKDYKTFSCSSEVAFWVYERYTDCKHQDNDGEIIIMRSEPMTPRSTEGNIWYQGHGWHPTIEYKLLEILKDGEVEIAIYSRIQDNITLVYYNYSSIGDNGVYSIGLASTDMLGNYLIPYYNNPILIKDDDEDNIKDPFIITIQDKIFMYYTSYKSGEYVIKYAISNNGINFTKQGIALSCIDSGWENCGVGACSVYDTHEAGSHRYAMMYSGVTINIVWSGIGYAYSADGITWTRGTSNPIVPLGNYDQWDDMMIWGTSTIVKVNDIYYMHYGGKADRSFVWKTGLVTWTEFEGTYTKYEGNPIISPENTRSAGLTVQTNSGTVNVTVADTTLFKEGMSVWLSTDISTANDEFNRIASIINDTTMILETKVTKKYPIGSIIRSWNYGAVSPQSILNYNSITNKWITIINCFLPYAPNYGTTRETVGYMISEDGINWIWNYADNSILINNSNDINSAENYSYIIFRK